MHRGIATFTLDHGRCPPWLFARMVKLGRAITEVLIGESGPDEFVKRLGDPVWFQSLGTVLAFDWNASGLTTTLTAALKEAIRGQERHLGVFICGGKGKTSRKTPDEILNWGERINLPSLAASQLVHTSKMTAKVDSSLVQDGYQIYHHAFFFSRIGTWTVVQQGMNTAHQTARRYHWSDKISSTPNFIENPHTGIAAQKLNQVVLNLTAATSQKTRTVSTQLVQSGHSQIAKDIQILRRHSSYLSRLLSARFGKDLYTVLQLSPHEFCHHPVELENFLESPYLKKIFQKITASPPNCYEDLLALPGVGPKTIRALALIAEVIYAAPPSYKDPARYSFAHGGKDGTPFFVDRETYDTNIQLLSQAILKSHLSPYEKDKTLHSFPPN